MFLCFLSGSFHVNWTKASMSTPSDFYEIFTILSDHWSIKSSNHFQDKTWEFYPMPSFEKSCIIKSVSVRTNWTISYIRDSSWTISYIRDPKKLKNWKYTFFYKQCFFSNSASVLSVLLNFFKNWASNVA